MEKPLPSALPLVGLTRRPLFSDIGEPVAVLHRGFFLMLCTSSRHLAADRDTASPLCRHSERFFPRPRSPSFARGRAPCHAYGSTRSIHAYERRLLQLSSYRLAAKGTAAHNLFRRH